MVNQKYITAEQAAAANAEPLPTEQADVELRPRDAWTQQVQDRLFNDPRYAAALGATPAGPPGGAAQGRPEDLRDPRRDRAGERGERDHREPCRGHGFTSSLVAMDPNTGAVKAMVAGPGFETNQYNIATHTPGRRWGRRGRSSRSRRRSTNGYSPNDTVSGTSPCSFKGMGQTSNAEGEGGLQYDPRVDGVVDQLRVRTHRGRRRSRQGHRHGAPDGHRAGHAHPDPDADARHDRRHPAGDGDGHVDRRERRRAPQPVLRAEDRRARRRRPLRAERRGRPGPHAQDSPAARWIC